MSYTADYKTRNTSEISEERAMEFYGAKDNCKLLRYGIDALGQDINGLEFCRIPIFIRKSPDFIAISENNAYFIEVKGCTSKGLRIKGEDLTNYKDWGKHMNIIFFIYNVWMGSYLQITIDGLIKAIADSRTETKRFPDNNREYYLIDLKSLPDFTNF